jgi:hypothetical protein
VGQRDCMASRDISATLLSEGPPRSCSVPPAQESPNAPCQATLAALGVEAGSRVEVGSPARVITRLAAEFDITVIRTFTVPPSLPPELERRRALVYYLRWAWNHDAIELFSAEMRLKPRYSSACQTGLSACIRVQYFVCALFAQPQKRP